MSEFDGKEKLTAPDIGDSNIILYNVNTEKLFDLLQNTRLKLGHGDCTLLEKELPTKYINITKEAITLYLHLCNPCQT